MSEIVRMSLLAYIVLAGLFAAFFVLEEEDTIPTALVLGAVWPLLGVLILAYCVGEALRGKR